jgi:hypothetical protein
LIAALTILVAWFVARPLFSPAPRKPRTAETGADSARSALLAERDRILSALQDLDFDNTLGKIPAEDYPVQRAELVTAGAEVLRKLDELDAAAPKKSANAPKPVSAHKPAADDDVEKVIAARRRERARGEAGFCAKCGNPLQRVDHFCPKCGAPVPQD